MMTKWYAHRLVIARRHAGDADHLANRQVQPGARYRHRRCGDPTAERQAVGGGGKFDSGDMANTVNELGEGWSCIPRRGPVRNAWRDLDGQHVGTVEAGIDSDQRQEASQEQRSADEQDEGERDFSDDECASQTPRRGACAGLNARFQGGGQVRP
jgi:hypothetical protein